MKDVRIVEAVEFESEDRRWKVMFEVGLRAYSDGKIARIFRNAKESLLNERLCGRWGSYKENCDGKWRFVQIVNYFDDYNSAKEYLREMKNEVIGKIEDITKENIAEMSKEIDKADYFTVDRRTGVLRESVEDELE